MGSRSIPSRQAFPHVMVKVGRLPSATDTDHCQRLVADRRQPDVTRGPLLQGRTERLRELQPQHLVRDDSCHTSKIARFWPSKTSDSPGGAVPEWTLRRPP